MQNRGNGFSLAPGHPNRVAGGKRPYHTIIPGFVTEGGAPRMSFGFMGGHMQHQGHVQTVHRIFDLGENPAGRLGRAPLARSSRTTRWRLETGFAADVASDLAARGHRVAAADPAMFGGAQLILRVPDGYCAASDHRKEGMAAGF